jgi:hypothetical protein
VEFLSADGHSWQLCVAHPLNYEGTMNDQRENPALQMFRNFKLEIPGYDADVFINWMTDHLSSFRHTMRDSEPYDMVWIDDNGAYHRTTGCTLRDCVSKALQNLDTTLL